MNYEPEHLRQEAEYTWPFVRDNFNIRTLINIGAHNGEFADFLMGYFKTERAYLFEPQTSQHASLRALCERRSGAQLFANALSDFDGKARFFTNDHSPSSSLLEPGVVAVENFPGVSEFHDDEVEVRRLDSLLRPEDLGQGTLIVMDAQGAEEKIIRGGRRVFSAIDCLLVEMSFVPFYAGQPLFEGVHDVLVECGLRLRGFKNQICSDRNGGPLFAHCLYVRDRGTGS